jgi:hypothetical protein
MRGNAARALVPGLVVLALVAVVTIAATGSTPSGSGDTREPADALLDTFFSLMLLAYLPAAALLIWALMQRRQIAEEMASGRYQRNGLIAFCGLILIFGALAYWRRRDAGVEPGEEIVDPVPGVQPPTGEPPERGVVRSEYEPEFAWIPVLVVVGLVAVGALAAYLSARRRKGASGDEVIAEALATVLDETLDDLRAERDPRRAVIAAYARLERALAAHGLARRPAETAEEYLQRILPRLDVEPRSVRRLTDLFARAKFSPHMVDVGMKEEAIDALSTVRDELQAAEARRLEERMRSLTAAAERA